MYLISTVSLQRFVTVTILNQILVYLILLFFIIGYQTNGYDAIKNYNKIKKLFDLILLPISLTVGCIVYTYRIKFV